MTTQPSTFFSSCPRGLEHILAEEIEEIGASHTAVFQGGVSFTGSFHLCYEVNLKSRIASRVLWQVFSGEYRREQDVYNAAYAQPWTQWFPVQCRIKVKVSAQHCPLPSLEFITLRVKDAICDRFLHEGGIRPSVDTRKPDIRINVFLNDHQVLLFLDTSGEPLFKRGLRHYTGAAPIRENLAAGILRLTGWTPEQTLFDPMCGSGTFLMEAAHMARNIAPGLHRRFAFERLNNFSAHIWDKLRQKSQAQQLPSQPLSIFGCDRQNSSLDAARSNLKHTGLIDCVSLRQSDVLETRSPTEHGIILTNPPYGVRTGQTDKLAALYPRMGDWLKRYFPGWRAYLFSADLKLPKLIGLAASARTPLFNGPLECRLFEYRMFSGPKKPLRRPSAIAHSSNHEQSSHVTNF